MQRPARLLATGRGVQLGGGPGRERSPDGVLGNRIGALARLTSVSTKFRTTEDAVWLVFGFLVFAGAAAVSAVSLLIAGGKVATPIVFPLAGLMIASAAILEFGLRRLHVNLTGKRMSPWPLGFVSLHTLGQAVMPSTI